mgnify:CR=1 FL=1
MPHQNRGRQNCLGGQPLFRSGSPKNTYASLCGPSFPPLYSSIGWKFILVYWYTKEYAPAIVMGGFFIEPIAETTMLSPCLMFDSTQTVNLTATALPLK